MAISIDYLFSCRHAHLHLGIGIYMDRAPSPTMHAAAIIISIHLIGIAGDGPTFSSKLLLLLSLLTSMTMTNNNRGQKQQQQQWRNKSNDAITRIFIFASATTCISPFTFTNYAAMLFTAAPTYGMHHPPGKIPPNTLSSVYNRMVLARQYGVINCLAYNKKIK